MKFAMIAMLMIVSVAANARTCFEQTGSKASFIPAAICFDKMEVNLDSEIIFIEGSESLPARVASNYLVRKNEDYFRVKASIPFVNSWESGCGAGLQSTLNLNALTDNYGEVNAYSIEVTVDYSLVADVCHSRPQTGKVVYQLKK